MVGARLSLRSHRIDPHVGPKPEALHRKRHRGETNAGFSVGAGRGQAHGMTGPLVIALVFGLTISLGLYFLWPAREPEEDASGDPPSDPSTLD